MDLEHLKTASGYLVATFLTTGGLATIIDPISRSRNFGINVRSEDKATLGFIKPIGARDLSLGLIIGMLMYHGDQKYAGLVSLIALLIPTMDAWAVWNYNGRLKEVWPHVIGGGFVGAVGVWLLADHVVSQKLEPYRW